MDLIGMIRSKAINYGLMDYYQFDSIMEKLKYSSNSDNLSQLLDQVFQVISQKLPSSTHNDKL